MSYLFAGWDRHYGFQLYQTDPSGNYGGWKATAIGANSAAASSILKSDYKEELSLSDALSLTIKVLTKTMDSTTLSPDKLELSTVTMRDGKLVQHELSDKELESLLRKYGALAPPETGSMNCMNFNIKATLCLVHAAETFLLFGRCFASRRVDR